MFSIESRAQEASQGSLLLVEELKEDLYKQTNSRRFSVFELKEVSAELKEVSDLQ